MQKPASDTTATNPIRVVGRRNDLKKCSALRLESENQRYINAFFMVRSSVVRKGLYEQLPVPTDSLSPQKTRLPGMLQRALSPCCKSARAHRTPFSVRGAVSEPGRKGLRPAPTNGRKAKRMSLPPRASGWTV